jgi:hypothetical protein
VQLLLVLDANYLAFVKLDASIYVLLNVMYELIYVCIYVTRCTNSLYELDECCYQQIVFCFILCLLLQTKCILCFLFSNNE